jgi:hypothetical protein
MPRTSSGPSAVLNMFRSLFVKDLGRKIVALVLAIGLWFLISKIVRIERPNAVEVLVVTNPAQESALRTDPNSLVVDVPSELVVVDPKNLTKGGKTDASVILSGPSTLLEGEGGVRITARYRIPPNYCETQSPRTFTLDPGAILINSLRPPTGVGVEIQDAPVITLARRESRRVHIDYRNFPILGRPQEGWELDEKNRPNQVTPLQRQVTISGPAEAVHTIEVDPTQLRFQPIDITRGDKTISQVLALDKTVHPFLTLEDPPTGRVSVDVVLTELREERTLKNVRVVPLFLDELVDARLRDLPAGDSPIQPPPNDDKWNATVTLSAPRTFWATVDPETLRDRIHLWVNLRQLIGSGVRLKNLNVESSGMRGGPENAPWPAEVQFKKVTPDLILVTLHE